MTELVTVIRTKLRCHILLARGGRVGYPGEGGEIGSFYRVIVAVIIGVDRLLYLFVIIIPLKSSAELSYYIHSPKCWTGLEYQRPGGSNVNILYGGEERRGEERRETSKKIK